MQCSENMAHSTFVGFQRAALTWSAREKKLCKGMGWFVVPLSHPGAYVMRL